MTDARNGTTTNFFDAADRVYATAAPAPFAGQAPQTQTNFFDSLGRAWKTILPDGTSVTNRFAATGLLTNTVGSRTYPVGYTYDSQGRMKTMTTWQDYAQGNGAGTTHWDYDHRGFLTNKVYEGNAQGPRYTYTAAGRLQTRTWARGITTSYGYNGAGELATVVYSDGITPNFTNGINRRGQMVSTATASGSMARSFGSAGQFLAESFAGGPLGGVALTNGYDAYLRRSAVGLSNAPSTRVAYGFDTAGRLSSVANGLSTASYSYVPNSRLVAGVTFKRDLITWLTTTKSYDFANRVTAVSNTPYADLPMVFNYANNAANQRTSITNADGSRWEYQYDSLGQVNSGKKVWSDGTPVAGQQFEYALDDIGNRKLTKAGGDQTGSNLRLANYTNNVLNQITGRDVPGAVDVLGLANSNATVTVNGLNPYRRGEYFRSEVGMDNAVNPAYSNLNIVATLQQGTNDPVSVTNAGNALLAVTPEGFTYDADGNLTSDGLWTNRWDAENRLVACESSAGVPPAAWMKEEWAYLPDGRWSQRVISAWNGSNFVPNSTNRFAWDGPVLFAILDSTNGVLQSFVRGIDLSGTLQGAGGVGGLLMVHDQSTVNGQASTHYVAFDANGNVMGLVSAPVGEWTAQYQYGPFGETLRATGSMAKTNVLRYSTQFTDDVTGDHKYLYRHYASGMGCWKSRDPIGENGGENLYSIAANTPINGFDLFGLQGVINDGPKCCTEPKLLFDPVMQGMIERRNERVVHIGFTSGFGDPASVGAVAASPLYPVSVLVGPSDDFSVLRAKLESALGPGNCVRTLLITGHGSAGFFGSYGDPDVFQVTLEELKKPDSATRDFFQWLSSRMCKGRCRVDLMACEQAKGNDGPLLMKMLAATLNADVTGFDDWVAIWGRGKQYQACPDGSWNLVDQRKPYDGSWTQRFSTPKSSMTGGKPSWKKDWKQNHQDRKNFKPVTPEDR